MHHLLASFGIMAGSLIAVTTPLAGVPVFLAIARPLPAERRPRLAWRVAGMVIVVLVCALVFGRVLLHLFGISLGALEIAGGLLVGFAAWQLLRSGAGDASQAGDESALFSPLTMPLLAGPGAMGTVIAHATRADHTMDYAGFALGIVAAGAVILLVMLAADRLSHRLTPRMLTTINQVMGLILLAIGAEMVLHGAVEQGLTYSRFS